MTPTLAPQYPQGTSEGPPTFWRPLILVRLGQKLIVNGQLIAVTGNFGFLAPILAGGDHQRLDSDLVHDRLCHIRHRHDQDCDIASLVRGAGRSGRSGPLTEFRDSAAGLDRRMGVRDPAQCESWRRRGLALLLGVARVVTSGQPRSPAGRPAGPESRLPGRSPDADQAHDEVWPRRGWSCTPRCIP
jgi:hypothetical protein